MIFFSIDTSSENGMDYLTAAIFDEQWSLYTHTHIQIVHVGVNMNLQSEDFW